MAASIPIPNPAPRSSEQALDITLLDLISALAQETDEDHEVVAAVVSLLRSGRVRLCGNFRGCDPEDFVR